MTMPPHDADKTEPPEGVLASLYDELRRLAAAQLQHQHRSHTLQATALVNEAYLKLAKHESLAASSREEFARLAASVMRNVLVDHARAKNAMKRGQGWERVTLSATPAEDPSAAVDVLALDEALTELAAMDARMAELIELRFFGGLSEAEAAENLGVSRSAVTRDWRMARAWLATKLRGGETRE